MLIEYFGISFIVIMIVIIGMSVGVLFKRSPLKGSCGGLGKVMNEECMFCSKKDQCEREK